MEARYRPGVSCGHKLVKPIVSCPLGRLYNKEAVINHILERASGGKSHIKKLSDVVELQLTDNKSFKSEIKADLYIDHYNAPYMCPVLGLEMSGRYRFVYNWACGCVVSERVTIEIPTTTCHKCGKEISADDNIIINGTEEETATLMVRMKRRKDQQKAERKQNKAAKEGDEEQIKPSKAKKSEGPTTSSGAVVKKQKTSEDASKSSKYEETESYKKLFHKNSTKKDKAHWECAAACKSERNGLEIDASSKLNLSFTYLVMTSPKGTLHNPCLQNVFPNPILSGWEPVIEMDPHIDENLLAVIEKLGGRNLYWGLQT
eukprot:sb/3466932/